MSSDKPHPRWTQLSEYAWFRDDFAYAGKDHTKNDATYIGIAPYTSEEKGMFKTIADAMEYIDSTYPPATGSEK